jgi:enoyl-CoA hydratase
VSEAVAGTITVRLSERAPGARVAFVTVDRPRKLNALGSPLMARFVEVFAELEADSDIRAVVLDGAGDKAFIGGADVDELARLDRSTARAFITRVHRCCDVVRKFPAPVIARINGYALGAGLEVAASCDLRVAVDTARFGMPEVKLGIPSVVEAAVLPRLIPAGRAREILLLGHSFSATDAAAWGLVERVVSAAEIDTVVEAWLAEILTAGPQALGIQKALMRQWEELPLSQAIAAGIDAFASAWDTDEPRRMMDAFQAAKRKPVA